MLHSTTVRRSALAVLAATLSVGMMACNKNTPPATNAVTNVVVSAPQTTLTTGQTTQAVATVTVTGTAAKTVTWDSDNKAAATVSSTGLITAVAAGSANIKACSNVTGYTSKCGTVKITVNAPTGGVTLTPATSINFQPAAFTPTPTGYTANTGAAYDATSMIGWVTEATAGTATPTGLDMANNTRDRSASASKVAGLTPEQYTQVNMQCAKPPATVGGNACSSGTQTPGAFEYKVVNGTYTVTVSVGESTTTDFNSIMALNVEGTNFVTNFTPSSATPFSVVTKDVKVTDGSLTVDAKTGINTKIQYLKIVPAANQQ